MQSFARLLALTALAASASGMVTPRDADLPSACQNGAVASNKTISASGIDIVVTTFSCGELEPATTATTGVAALSLGFPFNLIPWFPPIFGIPFPFPKPPKTSAKPSSTSSAVVATPTPVSEDVCNELCTNTCGSIGSLPPISEDCQQIFNSITILNGSLPPTFDLPSNHIQQLNFGTCRVFFENFSNHTMTECWSTVAKVASVVGTQCFPPTQPVMSAGFCSPDNAAWQIGIAHA